ncbi:hypothetical protein AB0P15_01955 [Streptomyces sp. NPDC087917]|uniref:hypothetical protein n=1 Tax=Streptomyces sp. NPDC087917 TaxID=3155060 RepID=UPI003443A13F
MSKDVLGLLVGMALAFAGWFGGFGAFLLVTALGGLGFWVGARLEEGMDLRDLPVARDRSRR